VPAKFAQPGGQRQAEEIGTTLIVLSTLRVWVRDERDGELPTREYRKRQLERGDAIITRMFGGN
jgi:hypothetical protein